MFKYRQEVSVFDDEKRIFGQTIWLLHSFLRNLNTKRLISPEREGFRDSNFVRFILGIYICLLVTYSNLTYLKLVWIEIYP